MLLRIVRLQLKPENVSEFRRIFEETKPRIEKFQGCQKVELFRDLDNENIWYTHSYWKSPEDLEAYRHSDYFEKTWRRVKPLFAGKAEAFSLIP